MLIEPRERPWFRVFALTLAALAGLALLLTLRLPSFRDPPFDFYAMRPDEKFNVYGLTRRQEGSVKLGFAESYPPPEIGAYGNHIIRYFGADAFGRPSDARYFFNYWYANLSLPELHSYLRHVERAGHLPRKLILVQITPPNADNGDFIINWGNELPADILWGELTREGPFENLPRLAEVAWQVIKNELHEVLNYNTFILGMTRGGGFKDRLFSDSACQSDATAWLLRLPYTVQTLVGAAGGPGFYCLERTQSGAFKRDGSVDAGRGDLAPPIQNEYPLVDAERALNAGDEVEIAIQMRAIDAIGRRNNIKVVFLVPPVYETDRDDSVANKVFNRALALAPELTVIDNRDLRGNASYFRNYLHASPEYFKRVVAQLRERKLID